MSDCVRAQYNVSEDKVFNLRWGGVEWDYAQIILRDGEISGFRMVVQSPYLTSYYQIKNLIENKDLLFKQFSLKSFFFRDTVSNYVLTAKYETTFRGYQIIFDMYNKRYKLVEKSGKLFLE
jgi:hypothetical protein